MSPTLGFVFEHRYALLFAAVFLNQLGVPLPALPVLLGAGALARDGRLELGAALALAVAASVITHAAWYEAGRAAAAACSRFFVASRSSPTFASARRRTCSRAAAPPA